MQRIMFVHKNIYTNNTKQKNLIARKYLIFRYYLTIYIGLPQSVAAITPSCKNLAKPKSAKSNIFFFKCILVLYQVEKNTFKQMIRFKK